MPSVPQKPTSLLEWTLPDVLPGVCRIFLQVPTLVPNKALPQPVTFWQHVRLGDSGLVIYTVRISLKANRTIPVYLEAVFLDEPTLDQMNALEEFASRLDERGLPALVSGQF